MSKKIGFYKLDNVSIKLMDNLVKRTQHDQKEHGFDLCANPKNILVPRNICHGNGCDIERKGQCKENEFLVGGFHTHIRTPEPSLSDLALVMEYGMECIGSGKYDKVNCYTIKKNIKSKDRNDIINKSSEIINKAKNITYDNVVKMKKLEDLIKKEYVDKKRII